jgi:hypothetical protein
MGRRDAFYRHRRAFEHDRARQEFSTDEVLLVEDFYLGNSCSTIAFQGHQGEWNGVM